MSDFIASLGPAVEGKQLLGLLRQPYGEHPPAGWSLQFSWGALAVLDEAIVGGRNRVTTDSLTLAWVGDLVFLRGEAAFREALHRFSHSAGAGLTETGVASALKASGLLEEISGAFALVLASEQFLAVVTDPMASVQVYQGGGGNGSPCVVGTHPDLVACATGASHKFDPVSVSEFINNGIACCPYTMHQGMLELPPGTVRVFSARDIAHPATEDFQYWAPPSEQPDPVDEEELLEEFVRRWSKAMLARCGGQHLAVQLSGGLDSRVVIASIPAAKDCVGLTLCDEINREARVARQVAHCYGREWIPLHRDPEYLGRTATQAIHFTGCEGEWHHGHTIGFAERVKEMGIDAIFTGLLMDNNFKGYYAQDMVRVSRWGGLLPAGFRVKKVDYANQLSAFCRAHLTAESQAKVIARRAAFAARHFAQHRGSVCEWLDGYPYSQACDNTGWVVERRCMPLRLPVMDRPLLDLAFRVPMRLKAGGRFFERAAFRILGPGNRVPNANDGVRPGSGHLSRLAQRAVRKVENSTRKVLPRLGFRLQVPHSWHDFEAYWRESSVLEDLRRQHGANLEEFAGPVFSTEPAGLLRRPELSWQTGSRLLQLAMWRSVINEYHLPKAGDRPAGPSPNSSAASLSTAK